MSAPDGASLWSKTDRVGPLFRFLRSRPTAWRDLPRWVRDWFGSPLDRRQPWWPYSVARSIAQELKPGASVFEYGGGGSTLWLEDRGCLVTTIEHDPGWYEQLVTVVGPSTTVRLVPAAANGSLTSTAAPGRFFDAYVAAVDELPPDSQDLVIVDGRARVACVMAAMRRVRPGGLLLLDDSERQEYEPARRALQAWTATTFTGLKPGGLFESETTVWRRPVA